MEYSDMKSISPWFYNKSVLSGINKQVMIHPCQIDGYLTLIYERDLEFTDPRAFAYLRAFAEQNDYVIKEDRRSEFIEGIKRVKDKRSANVMSLMIMASCLFTSVAFADDKPYGADTPDMKETTGSHQISQGNSLFNLNLNVTSRSTDEELMSDLLSWINDNSSYNHHLFELPKIVKVSNTEIAQIAFGKTLPAAIDPYTLGIKGLYNFNNKTIYIVDTLDLSLESDRAILLHELVHFLQYQHNEDKSVECKNELELLAYRLEAKYLNSHNHKADFGEKHIANVVKCS